MANAQMTNARTPNCPKTKLSEHLGKAVPISGTRPAGATMRTRLLAVVVKGRGKGRRGKKHGQSRSNGPKDKAAKSAPLEVEI